MVGNDNVPEFSAKTLPPGSAPKSQTFTPNTTSEVPGQADNANVERSHGKESTKTSASDTLGGSTSGDVYQGLGHPGQGMTSSELRHDGGGAGKKERKGLVGVGASGASAGNMGVDERMQPEQRALERESGGLAGTKGMGGRDRQDVPGAEEREAVRSEEL